MSSPSMPRLHRQAARGRPRRVHGFSRYPPPVSTGTPGGSQGGQETTPARAAARPPRRVAVVRNLIRNSVATPLPKYPTFTNAKCHPPTQSADIAKCERSRLSAGLPHPTCLITRWRVTPRALAGEKMQSCPSHSMLVNDGNSRSQTHGFLRRGEWRGGGGGQGRGGCIGRRLQLGSVDPASAGGYSAAT